MIPPSTELPSLEVRGGGYNVALAGHLLCRFASFLSILLSGKVLICRPATAATGIVHLLNNFQPSFWTMDVSEVFFFIMLYPIAWHIRTAQLPFLASFLGFRPADWRVEMREMIGKPCIVTCWNRKGEMLEEAVTINVSHGGSFHRSEKGKRWFCS